MSPWDREFAPHNVQTLSEFFRAAYLVYPRKGQQLALTQSRLAVARSRAPLGTKFKKAGQMTAFLCHSHKDRAMAEGLQQLLKESGVDLYIDWQDSEMPEQPNRETADRIKSRILQTDRFVFLATSNSMNSRWCPWEIGFADGKKSIEHILLVPTQDAYGSFFGNEYLQLYRRIDQNLMSQLEVFRPGVRVGASVLTI